jgi:hypothetical protein
MLNTINALSRVRVFSIELALLFGVEEASLLQYFIQMYGQNRFDEKYPKIWQEGTLKKLVARSLIVSLEEGKYQVNYTHLESLLSPRDLNINIVPPFRDPRFLDLCERFRCNLKEKGRSKTLKEIYSLFEGKTLEESIEALSYSTTNKYIGIKFYEKPERSSKDNGTRGVIGSGGGETNRSSEGHTGLSVKIE